MNKKDALEILGILKEIYPDAKCSLDFETPFQMLVSTILSAQCTDERVNKTVPNLYNKYPGPREIAEMDLLELENIIKPCGLYKSKAKNIQNTSKIILENFGGKVPNNMKDLMTLPGVGRKVANVVMLEAFKNPEGVAVDTHCKRLSNRLGISKENDPSRIEQDILKLYEKSYYFDINHIFIWHGRNICKARVPLCMECPISNYCKYYKTQKKGKN